MTNSIGALVNEIVPEALRLSVDRSISEVLAAFDCAELAPFVAWTRRRFAGDWLGSDEVATEFAVPQGVAGCLNRNFAGVLWINWDAVKPGAGNDPVQVATHEAAHIVDAYFGNGPTSEQFAIDLAGAVQSARLRRPGEDVRTWLFNGPGGEGYERMRERAPALRAAGWPTDFWEPGADRNTRRLQLAMADREMGRLGAEPSPALPLTTAAVTAADSPLRRDARALWEDQRRRNPLGTTISETEFNALSDAELRAGFEADGLTARAVSRMAREVRSLEGSTARGPAPGTPSFERLVREGRGRGLGRLATGHVRQNVAPPPHGGPTR